MTTVQIKSFLMAAELLNFTAAAERLYISQPTLSHQISMLEQEVGSKLFERNNNVLILTQAGALLKSALTTVSAEISGVLRRIQEAESPEAGYLSVGLLEDQLLDSLLIDALHQMMKRRPKIEINIERRNSNSLYQGLMDGTLDVAVQLVFDEITYSDFRKLVLFDETEFVAIAKNHPAAKKDHLSRAEITDLMFDLPLVMAALDTFPQPMRGRLSQEYPMNTMAEDGDPRMRMVSSVSTIPLFVTAGLAFSFVNETNILSIDPNVKLIEAMDMPAMQKGLTWRNGNSNPALQEFIRLLEP